MVLSQAFSAQEPAFHDCVSRLYDLWEREESLRVILNGLLDCLQEIHSMHNDVQ
jgi:hypothetical protein